MKSESCSIVSDSLQPHGLTIQAMEFSRPEYCLSFLQEIFPTQGSNPGLPHCRQILYQLSYKYRVNGLSQTPLVSRLSSLT